MKCIRKVEERITEGHYAYRVTYYLDNEFICQKIINPDDYVSAIGYRPEYIEEIEESNRECEKTVEELAKKYPYCLDIRKIEG
jgi:hypothetical protein